MPVQIGNLILYHIMDVFYTLSHLENDSDVPEYACHRVHNLCVLSRIQKGAPGSTHTDCVLQRVSLGTLSDVTVVLGMRQSIVLFEKTLLEQ